MAEMPKANPVPDKPPLHLRGDYLIIAAPEDPTEACLAAPAIRALRNARPHATIAVTTPASLAPLWEREGNLNYIIPYQDRATTKEIIAAIQDSGVTYESSIAWETSTAAKAFAKLRIQQRFGYRLTKLTPHLNEPLDFTQPFGPPQHRVRYYMALVEKLSVDTMIPENFRTPPLPDRPSTPRIAIAPGSELGPAYRWPMARFVEVAELLLSSKLEVLILGHGASTREGRELARRIGEKALFSGDSSQVTPLLDTLAGCTTLLANDGVLPHFAAHVGIPTTVLFGPGNPVALRPLGRIHRILNAHVACSPCSMAKCPLDHRCLNELSADYVSSQVAQLIVDQT